MSRSDSTDGPDDLDLRFGEIVAGLRAEGLGGDPPRDEVPATDQPEARPSVRDRPAEREPDDEPRPSDWRGSDVGWDETMLARGSLEDDDEHYVPPDPPPLPTPGPGGLLMMLLFGLGLLLLIAPGFIGIGQLVGTPLGLVSLAAGLGVLVLRNRDNPPPGADPENGSQV